jgi:hypothetical protein
MSLTTVTKLDEIMGALERARDGLDDALDLQQHMDPWPENDEDVSEAMLGDARKIRGRLVEIEARVREIKDAFPDDNDEAGAIIDAALS